MVALVCENAAALDSQVAASTADPSKLYVVFFWADWHPPCKQMVLVVDELAQEHKDVQFLKVEPEKVGAGVAKRYDVQTVPTFVCLRGGKPVETLKGASAPKLVAMVEKHAKAKLAVAQQQQQQQQEAQAKAASDKEALNARLAQLVRAAPVMLFMKGEPSAPKCGFSRTTIELLKKEEIRFGYFDILTDNAVRQGLKTFSNWPTYPQLYIKGELVGGLDVLKELVEEGELKDMVPEASSGQDLNQRLKSIINQKRVMLFMKGSPDAPQCGFSRTIIGVLKEAGFKDFGHFDILQDNEVRQGLKKYSNWPTYPQLYVDGDLIGGLDVIKEMHEEGELAELAQA